MTLKVVKVAIGLVYQQGHILVGWRDENLHQGGCYEFPGGKVEAHELPEHAVLRELEEETGLKTHILRLFKEQNFEYPDRHVQLYFYICSIQAVIDQALFDQWKFIPMSDLNDFTFPAANESIIQRLNWDKYLCICTQAVHQPKASISLCYLKQIIEGTETLIQRVVGLLNNNKKVILNCVQYLQLTPELQQQIFAVHLNSQQLHTDLDLNHLIQDKNLIAACHSRDDVLRANALGCDAIFLSPVFDTPTHSDQSGIGWNVFQQLAQLANMPVYALGGIQCADLETAMNYGAYGVAGIRDFILTE